MSGILTLLPLWLDYVRLFCKQFYRLYYIYICISNHAAHFAILGLTIISGLNGWITGWWNSLTLFHWLVRVFLLSVYHYMFNVWLKPFNTIVLASLIINSICIYIMIIIDINWQPLICYPTPYIYIYIRTYIYIYICIMLLEYLPTSGQCLGQTLLTIPAPFWAFRPATSDHWRGMSIDIIRMLSHIIPIGKCVIYNIYIYICILNNIYIYIYMLIYFTMHH